jgi:hypothetical protein
MKPETKEQRLRLKKYFAEREVISHARNPYPESDMRHALFVALQIWDEYMTQLSVCASQDYSRLASFPSLCAKFGVTVPHRKEPKP